MTGQWGWQQHDTCSWQSRHWAGAATHLCSCSVGHTHLPVSHPLVYITECISSQMLALAANLISSWWYHGTLVCQFQVLLSCAPLIHCQCQSLSCPILVCIVQFAMVMMLTLVAIMLCSWATQGHDGPVSPCQWSREGLEARSHITSEFRKHILTLKYFRYINKFFFEGINLKK